MTVPTLYKYYPVSKNSLSALVTRKVWFADPTQFNDPFDCGFRIVDSSPDRFAMPCGIGLNLLVENFNSFKASGKGIDTFKRYREELTAALRNIGVLSLSEESSNMLMWSHYCRNHTGFCLEFTYKGHDDYPVYPVSYGADEFPKFLLEDFADRKNELLHQIIYAKSDDWRYENEWRVVRGIKKGEDRLQPWSEFLELSRVLLGVQMSEHERDTIIAILRGEEVEIVEMEQVPGKLQVQPRANTT